MKKILIALTLAGATLAACNDRPVNNAVVNQPAGNTTGGPCGDGTVLGPNEQCK